MADPIRLDPFQNITNVNWGAHDIIQITADSNYRNVFGEIPPTSGGLGDLSLSWIGQSLGFPEGAAPYITKPYDPKFPKAPPLLPEDQVLHLSEQAIGFRPIMLGYYYGWTEHNTHAFHDDFYPPPLTGGEVIDRQERATSFIIQPYRIAELIQKTLHQEKRPDSFQINWSYVGFEGLNSVSATWYKFKLIDFLDQPVSPQRIGLEPLVTYDPGFNSSSKFVDRFEVFEGDAAAGTFTVDLKNRKLG